MPVQAPATLTHEVVAVLSWMSEAAARIRE